MKGSNLCGSPDFTLEELIPMRKIACFLQPSYILLVILSLFVVIGIICEEASPLLAPLQLRYLLGEHLPYQRSLSPL